MHPDDDDIFDALTRQTPSARATDAHVRACEACARRREVLMAGLEAIATALPQSALSTELRRRLLDEAGTTERYAPFVDRVARLFEQERVSTASLLARAHRASAWRPCPMPGVSMLPAGADPRLFLLKMESGGHFPRHRHTGAERVLVMEGAFRDEGVVFAAGALVTREVGTIHDFDVVGEGACVCAIRLERPIELVAEACA